MEKTLLAEILMKKNNDYYRDNNDSNSSSYIHDSQINTARKVVMQLASNTLRTNHVVLVSPMQGGKTGTCNAVINVINKAKLYQSMCVKKFIFISGMNDCGLKNQTCERLIEQVSDANIDNVYVGKRSKRNLSKNKYFILKNSDLSKFDESLDNSVIFIDESHYGSNEDNNLTKFFYKNEIDWKNRNNLIERNIYIVSVSATPFEELVSDTAVCKKMVELETSDDYVGVSEYLEAESIFNADKDDICENGMIFDYIKNAHERMKENNENGVVIIRTSKNVIITENDYVSNNFNVFEMYTSGNKLEYDKFNSKIEELIISNKSYKNRKLLGIKDNSRPLLVIIKGAFRAGITIPQQCKDIIYMIYDNSSSSESTAQALLGRMCGYRSNKENISKTFFFLNKKYATMYSEWEKDFSKRNMIPCDGVKMAWVDNSVVYNDSVISSKCCGNIAFDLTDEEIKKLCSMTYRRRDKLEHAKQYLITLMNKNGINIKYDYMFDSYLSGKNHYSASCQKKKFDSFDENAIAQVFRPTKEFKSDTNRDYLTAEDLGKRAISFALDAEINITPSREVEIGGKKRMLIYYVEIAQKVAVRDRKNQYQKHKDTSIE